tara:strand:+ start:2188 stop:3177 length:990 start_codon:yes stop_codon:yes gene_type:complete
MTFFNKKEEVLDIKLTQFGKQLLSTGRFKPVYYAFFDDNILYDGGCASIVEDQNDIEPRIQENTPQNKTQHLFSSVETNFSSYLDPRDDISTPEIDRIRVQSTPEKEFSLVDALGDSDFQSTGAPNWKLTFLEGQIDNASYFLTSSYQSLQIPQVNLNLIYTTKILNEKETEKGITLGGQIEQAVFPDGSSLNISYNDGNKNLLLMVEEGGVTFDKENFEIEVFTVDPADGSYSPLSFVKKAPSIVNNLLIVDDKTPKDVEIDSTFVEFFFDVNVDSKITKRDICEGIGKVKSKGFYVDDAIECDDVPTSPFTVSPYKEGEADPVCEDE